VSPLLPSAVLLTHLGLENKVISFNIRLLSSERERCNLFANIFIHKIPVIDFCRDWLSVCLPIQMGHSPLFSPKKFLSGMCTISVFFDVFFVNTGHFSHSIKINRNSPMRAAPLTPLIIWSTYSNPEWNILRSKPLLLQLLVAHWLFTTVVNLGVHKFTLLYKNKWKYFISRTIFNI